MSETIKDKVTGGVDAVAGAGTSDKIEGGAKEALGEAQQKTGEALGDTKMQAEGAAKQIEGEAQQAVGATKDFVSDALENIKEFGEDVVDGAKAFGAKAADYIQDILDGNEEEKTDAAKAAERKP
jgi:uncharacterized protein YjbJ (UPF0337 family)